jgi:hypothetical protein
MLSALIAAGVISSPAQERPKETTVKGRVEISLPPDIPITALKHTSVQISKIRPDIPASVLMADAQIINDNLPQIAAQYAKLGFSDSDALWASQTAWKTARLKSPLRLNPEKTIDAPSFVEYVTTDLTFNLIWWRIRNENPQITPAILKKDRQLIEQAEAEIVASYKASGWSVSDVRNASLMAWETARVESPLNSWETIDQESFIEAAGEMGIMVFTSEPDQAEVFISSKKIGTTNKQKNEPVRYFPDGRKVLVRFVKPDFAPVDLECLAKGQDTVICKAQLKRQ